MSAPEPSDIIPAKALTMLRHAAAFFPAGVVIGGRAGKTAAQWLLNRGMVEFNSSMYRRVAITPYGRHVLAEIEGERK